MKDYIGKILEYKIIFPNFWLFLKKYPFTLNCFTLVPTFLMLAVVATIGSNTDITLFFTKYRSEHVTLTWFMTVFSSYINFVFTLLYFLIFIRGFTTKDLRLVKFSIAYVAVQLLFTFITVRFLKIAIGRPRPLVMLEQPEYVHFSLSSGNHSFPSGHTSEIVGAVTPLLLICKFWSIKIFFSLIIMTTAFSRIYLSRHHFEDIVAGCIIGSLASVFICYFSGISWRKKHEQ